MRAESSVDVDAELALLNEKLSKNIINEVIDTALPARKLELTKTVPNLNLNEYQGTKQVYNESDGKLYIWNGSSYATDRTEILATEIKGVIGPSQIANIPTEKLSGTITALQLAANSVGTNALMASSVNADKLAANSVTAGAISAGAVRAVHVASGSISTEQLAANSVTANELVAGAVAAKHIAANSIGASHIASKSITTDKLNVTNLSAISADLGTVTAGTLRGTRIEGNTIEGGTIQGTTITGTTINGGTIKGARIEGITVEADNIIGDVVKIHTSVFTNNAYPDIVIPASRKARTAILIPHIYSIKNKYNINGKKEGYHRNDREIEQILSIKCNSSVITEQSRILLSDNRDNNKIPESSRVVNYMLHGIFHIPANTAVCITISSEIGSKWTNGSGYGKFYCQMPFDIGKFNSIVSNL